VVQSKRFHHFRSSHPKSYCKIISDLIANGGVRDKARRGKVVCAERERERERGRRMRRRRGAVTV
jgi:hypothetical protein